MPAPKYRLVAIEWEDSQRPLAPWQWLDEYELPEAVRCISVGFVIAETKAAIALVPNVGNMNEERVQGCGIIRIPHSAVRRIVDLFLHFPREGKSHG